MGVDTHRPKRTNRHATQHDNPVMLAQRVCACVGACISLSVWRVVVAAMMVVVYMWVYMWGYIHLRKGTSGRTDVVLAHLIATEVHDVVDENRGKFLQQVLHHFDVLCVVSQHGALVVAVFHQGSEWAEAPRVPGDI